MTDEHGPNGAYSEVFEEASDAQQTQTIHRIRANSTIMQLKKILGECAFEPRREQLALDLEGMTAANVQFGGLQLPIEEKFVSTCP